jgi:hypothetical protein
MKTRRIPYNRIISIRIGRKSHTTFSYIHLFSDGEEKEVDQTRSDVQMAFTKTTVAPGKRVAATDGEEKEVDQTRSTTAIAGPESS